MQKKCEHRKRIDWKIAKLSHDGNNKMNSERTKCKRNNQTVSRKINCSHVFSLLLLCVCPDALQCAHTTCIEIIYLAWRQGSTCGVITQSVYYGFNQCTSFEIAILPRNSQRFDAVDKRRTNTYWWKKSNKLCIDVEKIMWDNWFKRLFTSPYRIDFERVHKMKNAK